jgi:hypothetical protein
VKALAAVTANAIANMAAAAKIAISENGALALLLTEPLLGGDSAATTTQRSKSASRKVSAMMIEMIEVIAAAADPDAAATAAADSEGFVATSTAVCPSADAAAAMDLFSKVSVSIASSFAILFFADDAIFSFVASVLSGLTELVVVVPSSSQTDGCSFQRTE